MGVLYAILHECLDSHIPLKSVSSKYSKRPPPWLSTDLLNAIKAKYSAKHLADRTQNPDDISHYKSVKNRLKCLICSAKLIFTAETCSQGPSILCYFENGIIGRQITKPSTIDSNVSLENINNFFQTVAVTDSHHSADTYVPPVSVDSSGSVKDSFHFDRVEPSTVVSLLRKLDIKKSTGPDGLSALFLKQVAEETAVPLTYLYNKSLSTGSFPAG